MDEHPVDHYGQRFAAAVVGSVIGLLIGLVGGIALVGFGDALTLTIVGTMIAMVVLAWIKPAPFLLLVSLIADLF